MRLFFDTEFSENGRGIDLISIGIRREDGAEYYAQALTGWAPSDCNDWVRTNVLPHLKRCTRRNYISIDNEMFEHRLARSQAAPARALCNPDCAWRTREEMRADIIAFAGATPEWWAWYASYDWVVLCQLFGRMVDLPKGWPMYVMDLKQAQRGFPSVQVPAADGAAHNALVDARRAERIYNALFAEMTRVVVVP